ncbi:NHLP leader peptide family RiPP precursor [Tenacibaculum aiptasiae]|uniref:NHLP leader peptide family RiPP precursor n=1 Tax=Tenacibaculum aiptasiae TaxID=426481 RepID=UPI00232F7AD0|nr:NHLP leader peptide family RiPP precursor [Tenacibaculum aiptasiae]
MKLTREQKLLQTIIHKAWEDNSFKQHLIENPIDAIKNLTGENVKVPEGKTIVVRDQTDSSFIYINIPAEPNMDDMELTEEQLEIVAGGGNPTPPIIDDPLSGIVGG